MKRIKIGYTVSARQEWINKTQLPDAGAAILRKTETVQKAGNTSIFHKSRICTPIYIYNRRINFDKFVMISA